MNNCSTATLTVAFGQSGRPRESQTISTGRIPRVARLLAFAHEIERRVRCGELDDLAHAARAFGLITHTGSPGVTLPEPEVRY